MNRSFLFILIVLLLSLLSRSLYLLNIQCTGEKKQFITGKIVNLANGQKVNNIGIQATIGTQQITVIPDTNGNISFSVPYSLPSNATITLVFNHPTFSGYNPSYLSHTIAISKESLGTKDTYDLGKIFLIPKPTESLPQTAYIVVKKMGFHKILPNKKISINLPPEAIFIFGLSEPSTKSIKIKNLSTDEKVEIIKNRIKNTGWVIITFFQPLTPGKYEISAIISGEKIKWIFEIPET